MGNPPHPKTWTKKSQAIWPIFLKVLSCLKKMDIFSFIMMEKYCGDFKKVFIYMKEIYNI